MILNCSRYTYSFVYNFVLCYECNSGYSVVGGKCQVSAPTTVDIP